MKAKYDAAVLRDKAETAAKAKAVNDEVVMAQQLAKVTIATLLLLTSSIRY